MSLYNFRQIWSEYHPEFEESVVSDNFLQLRFLIHSIKRAAAINFDLGPNVDFYKGFIANCSLF